MSCSREFNAARLGNAAENDSLTLRHDSLLTASSDIAGSERMRDFKGWPIERFRWVESGKLHPGRINKRFRC